ncbi:MAG: hypothetical protein H9535_04225 [Ignavibacteria bacterium]|nr:hypothetical protein [Ignavibacteria bacterium]
MKTTQTVTNKPTKRLFGILLTATILLLIPLSLQLTIGTGVDGQGFNWQLGDFVIAGFLLFGTGLLFELVLRKVQGTQKRILICGAILLAFLLIWADLAVGIFNIPGFSGS